MSFSVRLRRSSSTVYTFAAAPFVAPTLVSDYDDAEPPVLAGVRKTWTITGILYGASEAKTVAAYTALAGFFDGTLSQPDAIELLRDGNVVESITSSSYASFRLVSLTSPQSDLQWRGEMRFTMVAEAIKRVATSGKISKLTQTESWNYDSSGLLTRTLEGDVEVTSGNSAEDTARTLGLQLPGSDYAYVTNGPEGVDVTVLGRDGARARFRSVVAESGRALPGSVSPFFSCVTETAVSADGKHSTVIQVSAEGPGAESAVRSKIPASGALEYAIRVDDYRRTASATIRSVAASDPQKPGATITVMQTFTTEPGGKRIVWSRRSGGRPPVKHELSLGPVEVTEDIRITLYGALPPIAEIKFPAPLAGVLEDSSKWKLIGPHRTKIAAQESGAEWAVSIRRGYTVASVSDVALALVQAIVYPGEGASLESEFNRQGAAFQ